VDRGEQRLVAEGEQIAGALPHPCVHGAVDVPGEAGEEDPP
jgi:hypothetical protein